MVKFHQSALINAPVEKVFSIISDPNKIPLWRKDVPGISNVSGPAAAGTTFQEEVTFMGKKHLLMKVVECIPNTKLVIEAQQGMPMLPLQTFKFSSDGNKTRVDLDVAMKVSGAFKLIQFMLPMQLKKMWNKYFDTLNDLVQK